jgi:hypothetical protein
LPFGTTNGVNALTIAGGTLLAAGSFEGDAGTVYRVARWQDGWQPLEPPFPSEFGYGGLPVYALAVYGADLAVGGEFNEIAGIPNRKIAIYGPTRFEPPPCEAVVPSGQRSSRLRCLPPLHRRQPDESTTAPIYRRQPR